MVTKQKIVEREFLMPDGTIKNERELTTEEKINFAQKVMDVFLAPLAYDAVLRGHQRGKKKSLD